MLKTALTIERKFFFEVVPQKKANLMEKEKVKPLWGKNFKDFAISLTVFELSREKKIGSIFSFFCLKDFSFLSCIRLKFCSGRFLKSQFCLK